MNTTSNESMVLQPISTLTFFGSRTAVAQYVADLLLRSKFASASITITTRGSSEDCYVAIAITVSLEDTAKSVAQSYSLQLINT